MKTCNLPSTMPCSLRRLELTSCNIELLPASLSALTSLSRLWVQNYDVVRAAAFLQRSTYIIAGPDMGLSSMTLQRADQQHLMSGFCLHLL